MSQEKMGDAPEKKSTPQEGDTEPLTMSLVNRDAPSDPTVPMEDKPATVPSPIDSDAIQSELLERSVVQGIDPTGQLGDGVNLRSDEAVPSGAVKPPHARYEVVRALAQGGMGKVFLVNDCDLKRQIALKVVSHDSSDMVARFIEEAQVLAQLEHPNIVPLHELGVTGSGRPYCTMRYVRGRSLSQLIALLRGGDEEAKRPYSLTRLVQIFLQITHALDYAHARGVIHRDLKPSNIMLGEHGEVQVLDWGLAKVISMSSGTPARTRPQMTLVGQVLGTPSYMSPEQALGQEADQRSDVYSLGVILYEMLTLKRPFRGETSLEVLSSVVRDTPASPREAAPGRAVPTELDRACMRAMAKDPAARHQAVRQLHEEVERWLESETDKVRRLEVAQDRARAGRIKLDEYLQLKTEVSSLREEQERVVEEYEDWQPAEEKSRIIDVAHRLVDARTRLARAASKTVAILTESLGFHPENELARHTLADYYWDRLVDAERVGDEVNRDFFVELVAAYHDGKYRAQLEGHGSLTLASQPAGARVTLYRIVERGFRLVEADPQQMGSTPLGPITLPMGSYVAVLRHEGFRDVRYPIFISRNRRESATVRLYRDDEIGRDFVYIPAGTFIQGGDDRAGGFPLPRTEPHVDDFFIGQSPVTMSEYLRFINSLAQQDMESAAARSPRYAGESYLIRGERSFELPEVDRDGDPWYPNSPIFTVTVDDARAYCQWRSEREGKNYRLPTETEWEKAARGVDGRLYPWGNQFDGSLCNLITSRRERPGPVPVDQYPHDVSIYGVRGMAGNVRDFTASQWHMGRGGSTRHTTILRGGSWAHERDFARCAARDTIDTSVMIGYIGFRIVHSPAQGCDPA